MPALAAALTAALPALLAAAQAPKPAAQAPKPAAPAAEIVVLADVLEFDEPKMEYRLTGNVDLTGTRVHLKAAKMVVTVNKQRELQTAVCTGNVTIEKTQEDGTKLNASCQTLDYREAAQKAILEGGVEILQSSEKLARPARLTGRRVEMDLKTGLNVVHGVPERRASVHVEPKGEAGKPNPEPVDLLGLQIDMNQKTQHYVAHTNAEFRRTSSWLKAETITFELDDAGTEVRTANARGGVNVYQKNPKGTEMTARSATGAYDQATGVMTLEGQVHAEVKEPMQEKPQIYDGETFEYNERTGYHRLTRARARLPQEPARPAQPPR